jgi:hypothetical protein
MFNREMILKNLNTENYYIDKHSLDLFLEDWKIDSIYEDEDGLEFFDDLALEKIKKGIYLKSQGFDDEQIIKKLARIEARVDETPEPPKLAEPLYISDFPEIREHIEDSETSEAEIVEEIPETEKQEIVPQTGKNFTLDVSSQTLQMLAEAVAKKISDDIAKSDMAQKLIEAGGYKKDNEILAKQVQELLEHNRELSKRIEILESKESKSFWARFSRQK